MKSIFFTGFLIVALMVSGQSTQGMSLIFSDDFTTMDKGWHLDETTYNISKISLQNARIVLELFDQGTARSSVFTHVDFNKDFVLIAELGAKGEAKQNRKERSDFGLTFGYSSPRYMDSQAFYGMFLNFYQDGVKLIIQDDNDSFNEVIKGVTYNPKGYTKIALEKKGSVTRFFVNEKLIHEGNAINTAGGCVSFQAFRKMRTFMRSLEIYQTAQVIEDPISGDIADEIDILAGNISFESKRDVLTAGSVDLVNGLAQVLIDNPAIHLLVESHSDDEGATEYLLELTHSRASRIVKMMLDYGVPEHQISGKGLGDYYPIMSNLTLEGRRKNNRVEYKILKSTFKDQD